jgi:short-subunit dehydrogenase
MSRPLALITGASAGIGTAFAALYAAKGHDLALTARRADRLERIAADLRRAHGVQVLVLPADLADSAAPGALMSEIAAQGRSVDVLINNAGYGIARPFADTAWSEQRALLQVLAVAPCELAHLCLPAMIACGAGRILNVASLLGLTPGFGGQTLYARPRPCWCASPRPCAWRPAAQACTSPPCAPV